MWSSDVHFGFLCSQGPKRGTEMKSQCVDSRKEASKEKKPKRIRFKKPRITNVRVTLGT